MPPSVACVRLNPDHSGEVVWGERIDPARTILFSVPLPESERRFQDIVLNDGAENGTRMWEEVEYPVFNELEVWQVSAYSTFQAELFVPNEDAEGKLREICRDRQVGVEEWTTIRMICSVCSRGNPGPHECKPTQPEDGARRFGFGARCLEDLENVLTDWAKFTPEADYEAVELVLQAFA